MWNFLLVPLLGTIVPFSHGVSLKPGQPGGPWTKEEVEITVEKVNLLRDIISSSFCGSLVAFGGTIRVRKKISTSYFHRFQKSNQIILSRFEQCWTATRTAGSVTQWPSCWLKESSTTTAVLTRRTHRDQGAEKYNWLDSRRRHTHTKI